MRLIDADAIENELGVEDRDLYVQHILDSAPTIEVEPIKHGKWIMKWHTFYRVELPYCSACNKGATFKWDYCPNCGAKMYEVGK